jgi:ATP-dependent Clp protease protease subunit
MLNNMNTKLEFQKFATKHLNINSQLVDNFTNGLTPYILEEREMRATQIDVFSRLMRDRIIWVSGPVDQHMADIVQAQLLFLDSTEKKDITLYINSPGGSVMCGLGIVDLMNYIKSDVATVNLGMCASMGSVLLSSGSKGKRSSLIYSKVMTHQVSHGTQGNVQDTRINQMEAEKYNYILFKMLAKNCGKTFEEVLEFSRRDRWYNSDEALQFGLVDEIIGLDEQKSNSITTMLDGFSEYYNKEVLKS